MINSFILSLVEIVLYVHCHHNKLIELGCLLSLVLFLLCPGVQGVAAYVGWQSSSILKPLLQQGLSDTEEFVIYKALNALTCMCQLGLLQKPHIYEFVSDISVRGRLVRSQIVAVLVSGFVTLCPLPLAVAPFLCHPNLWIRYGAVGFITVVAQHLNVADVYCKLMPHLNPFITQPIIQVSPPLHHDQSLSQL